jgi:hypothetical protein
MNSFLLELWNRLGAKSPRFFQVLQWIFGALTFANLIPGALAKYFNVDMPPHLVNLCNDIAIGTAGFTAGCSLPVRNKPVAETARGVVTVTKKEDLPFTVKHERTEGDKPEAR